MSPRKIPVAKFIGDGYQFRCRCGEEHRLSEYAVAQLAMRHDVQFTCEQGGAVCLRAKDFRAKLKEEG